METSLADHVGRLACPLCRSQLALRDGEFFCSQGSCARSTEPFPRAAGVPVLVDFDSSILRREDVLASGGASLIARPATRLRNKVSAIVHPPNREAPRRIQQMIDLLVRDAEGRRPLIVVAGGGVVGWGVDLAYADSRVDVLAFDIYASPHTELIADGHRFPFADGSVDSVVIQAVLEHVLDPRGMVDEIHRVLSPRGLVYSDIPFLQAVHEGPYDFTRFTLSGHRYLYRDFAVLESGVVAGAGTQLVWALDHFCRALFRSKNAGRAVALAFSWLTRVDQYLAPTYSSDAASSTYVLARRADERLPEREIVAYYRGAQRVD